MAGSSFLGLDAKGKMAAKNNEMFMANLIGGLKGLGKQVLGTMAAEALIGAIKHTHQDSSRAAANWDIAFSDGEIRDYLSPHGYGTLKRYSEGANEPEVISFKAMVYGIGKEGPSGFLTLKVGGRLHQGIGIGQPGSAPRLTLFNPIMSGKQQRRDKRDNSGDTYAQNAWPGPSVMATLQADAERIGSGAVAQLLRDLNHSLQRAAGHKLFD